MVNTMIGRNEPCPCGSGKKYKKCCWNKDVNKSFKASKLEAGAPGALGKMASLFHKIAMPPSTEEKKEEE
jgi:hypothetical protein